MEIGGGKEIFKSLNGLSINFSALGGTGLVLTGGYSNFLSLASILDGNGKRYSFIYFFKIL